MIIGSSGSVGAAIAERLAQEGCEVIVHGRRPGLRATFEVQTRWEGDERSWKELESEVLADYPRTPSGVLAAQRTSPLLSRFSSGRSPTTSREQRCG